ncbi:hypothetical protein LINPERPRIM_LOCUS7941 [Linum perenne]
MRHDFPLGTHRFSCSDTTLNLVLLYDAMKNFSPSFSFK